jgi:hypothetical protein
MDTMKAREFSVCIGKFDNAPEIQRLLAQIAAAKKLKMPKDSLNARINLPAQGLSLVFKSEGPKSSRLVLPQTQMRCKKCSLQLM